MSVAPDPGAMAELRAHAAAHPYPLLFASLSGAHLYGFPSRDSDFDLRGVHVLPLAEIAGLRRGPDTIERRGAEGGLDLDLVTHDAAKFFRLLLRPNGYVLEQLFSPLVVAATPEHAELRELGRRCVTRRHARHYLGFAATQRGLLAKDAPPRVKPLLYAYRVLLTGIRLLRTGEITADLGALLGEQELPAVRELIARKRDGAEKEPLRAGELPFHDRELDRLHAELEAAAATSPLPAEPSAEPALHDLLLRLRGVR